MKAENCMLSGLTAKTLGRYQEATKMVEKSMEKLASGTADLSSADKVKLGRINNTIHTLQTAHRVVKTNQDLLLTSENAEHIRKSDSESDVSDVIRK